MVRERQRLKSPEIESIDEDRYDEKSLSKLSLIRTVCHLGLRCPPARISFLLSKFKIVVCVVMLFVVVVIDVVSLLSLLLLLVLVLLLLLFGNAKSRIDS